MGFHRGKQTKEKYKAKFKAARDWCDYNGYKFRVVTQEYFIQEYNNIPFDMLDIPNIQEKLRKIKNEANKTN